MKESANILVVDDHPEIQEMVGRLLRKNGHRITSAANGNEMRRALRKSKVDLILLDLMLPVEDGLELCRELRAGKSPVPIIMLTAKGEEIDRVVGLEMGADDYVAKPFSGRELLARIKAVLRRTQFAVSHPAIETLPPLYRFGKWSLHTAKRELEADDGVIVPLSSGEFNLLLAFLHHPQRILSRDQLLDLAKGRSTTILDRGIDLQVSRLRRKIECNPKKPELVKTAWGDGYILTSRVESE
jgi:two-component system OmpR family response regulator